MLVNVARFNEDNMRAEGCCDRGGVGMHVEHGLKHMAHEPDAAGAQGVKDFCNIAPGIDFAFDGRVVLFVAEDDGWGGAPETNGNACEFWNGTEIVVAELHEGGAIGVIHRGEWLNGDQDDGRMDFATENAEGGRGAVGHHIHEENIDIGGLDFWNGIVGGLGGVQHSKVRDFKPSGFEKIFDVGLLAVHFVQESVELRPIDMMADTEESGSGGEGFDACDFGSSGSGHKWRM